MTKFFILKFWKVFVCLYLSINTVSADEVVDLDKQTLKELQHIAASHTWECEWKILNSSGTKQIIIEAEDVTKKGMVGKQKSSYCPARWGHLSIEIKGDNMHSKNTNFPQPCVPSTGIAKLYKTPEGSYYSMGNYFTSNGFRGDILCKAIPK